MARLVQWEQQIGRRVRLRDLFVFFTVVEYGSMAKAGAKLGVSTPSVSEVIADLDATLRQIGRDATQYGFLVRMEKKVIPLEHLNLAWAIAGTALRIPGVWQSVQLLMDASGLGPRPLKHAQVATK